jgi:prepilin-type N-terminal cleavage/methylation domain-containing protein/prepilin-type processing-associated H-X9-DG protein
MRHRRGFTLIELLVVIGIIAIIAAILFPVFAQVRITGRRAVCLSNLRQIGTASRMYSDDYDGYIVLWQTGPLGYTTKDGVWTALIQPYLKNGGGFPPRGVFVCPNWSEAAIKKGSDAPDCNGPGFLETRWPPIELYADYNISTPSALTGDGTYASPYQQNAGSGPLPTTLGNGTNVPGAGSIVATNLSAVLRPAETMHVFDGATFLGPSPTYASGPGITTLGACAAKDMHQGGANLLFFDGHSKWIKGEPRSYLKQNAKGEWFRQYSTYSME